VALWLERGNYVTLPGQRACGSGAISIARFANFRRSQHHANCSFTITITQHIPSTSLIIYLHIFFCIFFYPKRQAEKLKTRQNFSFFSLLMPQYVDTIHNKSHINSVKDDHDREEIGPPSEVAVPCLWGVPLKYIS
jgi:hypothetical protein